ncbi:MAG: PEP-CTERM sorting domain-containing protein, partial [Verrucomicrobia bacterium]|nr:PEP-CTERM sorting domain-containing protein [Verrucomicrobiota bacterium]
FTGSADFNGRTSLAGAAPAWSNATGYVGVKFLAADFNGSDAVYNYGWIKLQTNVDASQLTVLAFGYNDVDGGAISAGQGPTPVPEPATSAALLALGAAGLVAYRQRKQLRRA